MSSEREFRQLLNKEFLSLPLARVPQGPINEEFYCDVRDKNRVFPLRGRDSERFPLLIDQTHLDCSFMTERLQYSGKLEIFCLRTLLNKSRRCAGRCVWNVQFEDEQVV